jgi:hypothetical protein
MKNPTASEMGRKGGSRKVKKGFAKLTEEERKEIAKRGVEARKQAQETTP